MSPFGFRVSQIGDETHYILGPKTWRGQLPYFGMVTVMLGLCAVFALLMFNDFQLVWPAADQFLRVIPFSIFLGQAVVLSRLGSTEIVVYSKRVSIAHRYLGIRSHKIICDVDDIISIQYNNGNVFREYRLGLRIRGQAKDIKLVSRPADVGEYERIARLIAGQLNVEAEVRKWKMFEHM